MYEGAVQTKQFQPVYPLQGRRITNELARFQIKSGREGAWLLHSGKSPWPEASAFLNQAHAHLFFATFPLPL